MLKMKMFDKVEWARQYRKTEQGKAVGKRYRLKHREKIKAYKKIHGPSYDKKYYEKGVSQCLKFM